ncbi:hypothetical protein [Halarcobacter ebronensis]|uniref:Uncharacterized protein n=1 Tax=Halarcobacter ebronensis TaxID=1462615 RepID=A0A4Q1ATK3_9BACT|nr:hypothetical protein [Halarcobacter ebronensis]QKF82480.1 hypothetical protein AEBR_2001 [Halarcobacter ebronensis]RXK07500.1 hypothetical protein CRV07_03295 [Halarcobacter ebronensis]
MILKYTGPKEIISAHGISFKNGKDDKYVYIYPAYQLYKAIHHEYEKGHIYSHNIDGKRINDEALVNEILKLRPELKKSCEEELEKIKSFLDSEIEKVEEHKDYNEEEKKVFKNNLLIMKDYRVQRETNKIIYYELIKIIVDDIIEHKLKEINSPFNERYWHILQSIQGELSNHNHKSIGSNLDTNHNSEDIRIILKINSIGK